MPLSFSKPDFFSEDAIRVVSRTLVHSLWQGMLLALLAGIIIFFTKKAKPFVRYNLLTGILLVFIAGIAITAFMQLGSKAPVIEKELQTTAFTSVPAENNPSLVTLAPLSITDRAIDLFNANAGWIVLAWLSVILLQSIRLATGLYSVYHLKSRQTFSAGEHWNKRIAELGSQLQINTGIRLLQSGIAKMPSVVGFFKPVILFPAGMLAMLPPDEIEAILIHELAHIRRKDFLVNLLQHVVEIIFFFNPAVKWVSSLIRQERENCCDDIAVGQTTDKRNYINALVSFEGFVQQPNPSLVNAFSGEKDHLINRVKRIIYNNNKTLNNMEKKFLAAGMIITSVFIFAFSANNSQPKKVEKIHLASQNLNIATSEKIMPEFFATEDTIPVKESSRHSNSSSTISSSQNGKTYKIVIRNDRVTELYVNGKKIPAEKMSNYRSITDEIRVQFKADIEAAQEDKEQSEKDMEEAIVNKEKSEKQMQETNVEMQEAKEQMEQDMIQVKKEMEETNMVMEQSKNEIEAAKLELESARIENANEMEKAKKDMELAKVNLQLTRIKVEQSKKEIARSVQNIKEAQERMELSKLDMERSKKLQENLTEDFIKEGIIKNKKELSSYKLDNEELIVNGVKQPEALHKKFTDKYSKGNNWTMAYNYSYSEEVK